MGISSHIVRGTASMEQTRPITTITYQDTLNPRCPQHTACTGVSWRCTIPWIADVELGQVCADGGEHVAQRDVQFGWQIHHPGESGRDQGAAVRVGAENDDDDRDSRTLGHVLGVE